MAPFDNPPSSSLNSKISPLIDGQLPDYVRDENPLFSRFIQYYYEYLEAAELLVDAQVDNVIQETFDTAYILDEDGNQLVTRGVKWNLKQEVKSQQGSLLGQTDWVVIRKADNDTAIPSNIQTWRDAIRTKATEMETAIDNAADTDAVAALFITYTTNEDGSVTKSGILYDWPKLGD